MSNHAAGASNPPRTSGLVVTLLVATLSPSNTWRHLATPNNTQQHLATPSNTQQCSFYCQQRCQAQQEIDSVHYCYSCTHYCSLQAVQHVYSPPFPEVVECCQVLLGVARCCQVLLGVARCCQVLLSTTRCCQVLLSTTCVIPTSSGSCDCQRGEDPLCQLHGTHEGYTCY